MRGRVTGTGVGAARCGVGVACGGVVRAPREVVAVAIGVGGSAVGDGGLVDAALPWLVEKPIQVTTKAAIEAAVIASFMLV